MSANRKFYTRIIARAFPLLMLTACTMATPEIRLNAGGVEMSLKQQVPIGTSASLSPEGKHLLTTGFNENIAKLWDLSSGAQIGQIQASANSSVVFTPNGKYALIGGERLTLWDVFAGRKLRTIGEDEARVVAVSSDGSKVLTYHKSVVQQGYLSVYEIESGNKISEWRVRGVVRSAALSPDGRYALTPSLMGSIALWDVATGQVLSTYSGHPYTFRGQSGFFSLALSPDGKYALSGGSDGLVKLYDIYSGNDVLTIQAHSAVLGAVTFVGFSPDGKYILSGGADGLVKLWDVHSGSEIRTYKVLSSSHFAVGIDYAALSADGKYMVSQSYDASVRIWNASTGEEMAVLIGFQDGEWLAITSEGYYNASEKGAEYLKVNLDAKEYGVDQFYDVFYRPDIVSAKLRGDDISGLVTLTMKDAVKNPPPTVEVAAEPVGTDQAQVKVCYSVKSSGGGIGEVRLFQNGKLVRSDGYYRDMAKASSEKTQITAMNGKSIYHDMRSVSVKGKAEPASITNKLKGDAYQDCTLLEAVPGENEVSISAFNGANTVQSPLKTVKFTSNRKPEASHLYILAIGVDRYRDQNVNLKYAAKDAKDIADRLRQESATIYEPKDIHTTLLTNEQATKSAILDKINELAKTIKATDSFILFAAGHGVLLQNQYYLLTHDYDGTVSDTSMLSSNEIVEMSKKILSLSQLFIFDTCHAGGMDAIVSGLYDARMSVLAKKMGLHIYASANSLQEALDGYQGNGLFSHTILQGLNNNRQADKNSDGKVSLVELGEYAKAGTSDLSKGMGRAQTPLIINFGKDTPVYQLR